jgi:hypothetical protein
MSTAVESKRINYLSQTFSESQLNLLQVQAGSEICLKLGIQILASKETGELRYHKF